MKNMIMACNSSAKRTCSALRSLLNLSSASVFPASLDTYSPKNTASLSDVTFDMSDSVSPFSFRLSISLMFGRKENMTSSVESVSKDELKSMSVF